MTTESLSLQATFGELLRRWRRSRGLSQGDFGELLHPKARHSTVSCWETGLRRPSWKFLRIPTKAATHSDVKAATHSEAKAATLPEFAARRAHGGSKWPP